MDTPIIHSQNIFQNSSDEIPREKRSKLNISEGNSNHFVPRVQCNQMDTDDDSFQIATCSPTYSSSNPVRSQVNENIDTIEHLKLKLCSWNVCGCRNKAKRDEIDSVLHARGVAVALLQEANIDASKLHTTNYTWHTGSTRSNRKRNLAILISKWHAVKVHNLQSEGPYVMCAEVTYTTELISRRIVIVNVHAPNKITTTHLARIGTLLGRYPKEDLLIVGDFNSHLAYEDSTPEERRFIGKISCHDRTNPNGEQLRFFLARHELSARTMQSDSSLLWTWTNGTICSQLDHVITAMICNYYVNDLKGRTVLSVSTDHKLITWSITPNRRSTKQKSKKRISSKKFSASSRLTAQDISKLQEPRTQKLYQELLSLEGQTVDSQEPVDKQWEEITSKTRRVAQETLRRKGRLPTHKQCRKLLARLCKYRFWMAWKPSEENMRKLEEVSREYAKTLKSIEEEECMNFFKDLQKFPVGVPINRTHKYLKKNIVKFSRKGRKNQKSL